MENAQRSNVCNTEVDEVNSAGMYSFLFLLLMFLFFYGVWCPHFRVYFLKWVVLNIKIEAIWIYMGVITSTFRNLRGSTKYK